MSLNSPFTEGSGRIEWNREAVLRDYRVGVRSRQVSIVGRSEVFSGKAKFGIFGDGKEAAQLAMAYAFEKGDFRSGYYRDQTFMFALDLLTPRQFFAQLYAHADPSADPSSAGRSMTSHFATRLLGPDGRFLGQVDRYNSSADLSPTGSQMPRLVGLAYASRLYRQMEELRDVCPGFSDHGNEIAFGTIGNASCAEGLFWEAVNAVAVLQAPMLLSIWDDGFGISVPNAFQMAKGDISRILEGFKHRAGGRPGLDIWVARGWNYPELCTTYMEATSRMRETHSPAMIHVTELTQPQGHSTSGNHERYKSAERLQWEKDYDCLPKMREWILESGFAGEADLAAIEAGEKAAILEARDQAWRAYRDPIEDERRQALELIQAVESRVGNPDTVRSLRLELAGRTDPLRQDIAGTLSRALVATRSEPSARTADLARWRQKQNHRSRDRYRAHLYSESDQAAVKVGAVPARYSKQSEMLKGFEVLNACLDAAFERIPNLIALGEDVGLLGGVNQGWAHLQEKYGAHRISDTGIREATIVGQAIGMALRGLRPIAEIQYLDYILYALQIISDDLATLRWRTFGGQKAPVIIRTRGHRLEGIWHSGSPMAGIINLVRGLVVCVPRNAVEASGFYNTLLASDDAGIVVEVLNGYRRKEALPDNIGELTVPLGVPDTLREGHHLTVVTYGACCEIAEDAALRLAEVGIDIEILDVRTLLPFDTGNRILESIRKTSRVLFLDEDVPGGATAYMMQDVLERQGAWDWLDAKPRTLTAGHHRPAYGSDGDYFSKPNADQVVETVYGMMHDADPGRFPALADPGLLY